MSIVVTRMLRMPCSCGIRESTLIIAGLTPGVTNRLRYTRVVNGVKRSFSVPNRVITPAIQIASAIEITSVENLPTLRNGIYLLIKGERCEGIYADNEGNLTRLKYQ